VFAHGSCYARKNWELLSIDITFFVVGYLYQVKAEERQTRVFLSQSNSELGVNIKYHVLTNLKKREQIVDNV